MKKIIFIITAMIVVFIGNVNAQLNTTKRSELFVTVCEYYMGREIIQYNIYEHYYYLCMSTDNQFETNYLCITLGETKEQALLTFDQLKDLTKTKETVYITDPYFGKITFTSYIIKQKGIAGNAYTKEIPLFYKKFRESIVNFNEETLKVEESKKEEIHVNTNNKANKSNTENWPDY